MTEQSHENRPRNALTGDAYKMRDLETGAIRDTLEGKLSFVKALSPIVLERYVQYLGKHRNLPDGRLRDWDNWKLGIDKEIFLDGLGRHFWASWLLLQGFPASDNHGPVTLLDSLFGVMFNAQGLIRELLEDEKEDVAGHDKRNI